MSVEIDLKIRNPDNVIKNQSELNCISYYCFIFPLPIKSQSLKNNDEDEIFV